MAVRAHLTQAAAEHCERTGATARSLAERFGIDGEAAEVAGLLHDWAREESAQGLLDFAVKEGLVMLPVERENPYLLHARVGAEQVRLAFPGIGLDVLSAIASHTVGSVALSPLDMAVYVADSIEPGRDFAGVQDLRAASETETLAELFAAAYAHSVAYVREKGDPLHPMTVLVAEEIRKSTGRSPVAPSEESS